MTSGDKVGAVKVAVDIGGISCETEVVGEVVGVELLVFGWVGCMLWSDAFWIFCVVFYSEWCVML